MSSKKTITAELDDIAVMLEKTGNADLAQDVDECTEALLAMQSAPRKVAKKTKKRSKKRPKKVNRKTAQRVSRKNISHLLRRVAAAEAETLGEISAELFEAGATQDAMRVAAIAASLGKEHGYTPKEHDKSQPSKSVQDLYDLADILPEESRAQLLELLDNSEIYPQESDRMADDSEEKVAARAYIDSFISTLQKSADLDELDLDMDEEEPAEDMEDGEDLEDAPEEEGADEDEADLEEDASDEMPAEEDDEDDVDLLSLLDDEGADEEASDEDADDLDLEDLDLEDGEGAEEEDDEADEMEEDMADDEEGDEVLADSDSDEEISDENLESLLDDSGDDEEMSDGDEMEEEGDLEDEGMDEEARMAFAHVTPAQSKKLRALEAHLRRNGKGEEANKIARFLK